MWAQTWSNVWDLVRPEEFPPPPAYDPYKNMSVMEMVQR